MGEDAVRVRVAAVVVDGVEDVLRELELVEVEGVALGFGGARGRQVADEVVGAVDDGAEAVAELGEDGVEVDRAEGVILRWLATCGGRDGKGSTYDHEDEIGETGLEEHFCGDVLDQQVHAVDGEVDTGVELEQLEDLGIEVDLRREVLDFDVDFANVN